MNPAHFSQRLFDLIEEDDRLIGLSAAVDIQLIEEPVSSQWVLSIAPRKDYPLPFSPSTRYGVSIDELDDVIRSLWGEIAQLALDTSKATSKEKVTNLLTLIPTTPQQQPSYKDWIPTDDPKQFVSVTPMTYWTVDRMMIKPAPFYFTLTVNQERIFITDPTGTKHFSTVESSAVQKPERGEDQEAQVSKRHDDTDIVKIPEFPIDSLDHETHLQIEQYRSQRRRYAFLDGLTTFAGIMTYFFGVYGAHSMLPFAGPIILSLTLLWAYNRDVAIKDDKHTDE